MGTASKLRDMVRSKVHHGATQDRANSKVRRFPVPHQIGAIWRSNKVLVREVLVLRNRQWVREVLVLRNLQRETTTINSTIQ